MNNDVSNRQFAKRSILQKNYAYLWIMYTKHIFHYSWNHSINTGLIISWKTLVTTFSGFYATIATGKLPKLLLCFFMHFKAPLSCTWTSNGDSPRNRRLEPTKKFLAVRVRRSVRHYSSPSQKPSLSLAQWFMNANWSFNFTNECYLQKVARTNLWLLKWVN